MAILNIEVDHDLSQAEALKRIKKLLKETKKQYGDLVTDLEEKWKGDTGTFSFTVKGYVLAGTLSVTPQTVVMRGELPLTLRFLKGKIEKMLRLRAQELLQ